MQQIIFKRNRRGASSIDAPDDESAATDTLAAPKKKKKLMCYPCFDREAKLRVFVGNVSRPFTATLNLNIHLYTQPTQIFCKYLVSSHGHWHVLV